MIEFNLNNESKLSVAAAFVFVWLSVAVVLFLSIYSNLDSQKQVKSNRPTKFNYLTTGAIAITVVGAVGTAIVANTQLSGAPFSQWGPIVLVSLFAPGWLILWMSRCENFFSDVADAKGTALDQPMLGGFMKILVGGNYPDKKVANKFGYYQGTMLMLSSILLFFAVLWIEG